MKKKIMIGILTGTMVVSTILSGCGTSGSISETQPAAATATEDVAEETTTQQVEKDESQKEESASEAETSPAEQEMSLVGLAGSGDLFTVNEHDYQIEKKTLPLYLGSSDKEDTSEIEVAFMDGITDVPYISVETMKDIISKLLRAYYEESGGKKYDLEIEKDNDTVLLTRESKYPAKIDFADNTIHFYDFDAFIRISEEAPLMDVISATGFNENGESHLFQKSDTSFERYGNPVTFSPGEYGIDLVHQDDEYYVPLQLISDLILSAYRANVLYNKEAVCVAIVGGVDYFDDKYYISDAPAERSDDLIAFNYKELCFALDALYGLKKQHNISDFNTLFQMTGLIEPLMSKNPEEEAQALADLLCKYLDDGHSGNIHKSYMMKEDPKRNWGPSCSHKYDETDRYADARKQYYPDGAKPYEEIGNTAYITFDSFVFNQLDYYTEKLEDNLDDTVALTIYAYQQITRENSPIENVVVDLSNNGGGDADAAAFLIGTFLGDGSISMTNPTSGALVTENFKVDVNLDRKFDEKDSLRDYHLFCMASPVSFSCGNLVPCVFKNSNRVTLIGQQSAGGACVIHRLTTADGILFQISGLKQLAYTKNGSFYDIDQGAAPDYVIPDPELLYNRDYMTKYINGLLGK